MSSNEGNKKTVRSPYPLPTKFPTPLEQKAYKTYNYIENTLWPIKPLPFVATTVALAATLHYKYPENAILDVFPKFSSEVAEIVKVSAVSAFGTYASVFTLRKLLKYFYFSYKGFLFDNPKKPSIKTKIWGIVRHILSISPPILESCDSLLPNLPVPSLKDTINEYLDSMKYILTDQEYETIMKQAETFLEEEGKKLQRYTTLYSLFTDNYVTSFWQKYAYLHGRYPLLINSSVAHVDLLRDKESTRAHRAARVTWIEVMSHLAVDRQQYKPLGDGLVCTRHYKNMYAVTREPGEKIDQLKLHGIQKHIVVVLRGRYYKIHVVDDKNNIYNIEQLTKIFHEMITRNEKEDGVIGKIAALTHDTRDSWHRNRQKYFLGNENNARILQEIESAVFFLTLDEDDDYGYDPKKPEILNNFLKNALSGDGANRWVDKSLNYICSKNARCGGTTEHSIADGAEFDHIMENFVYVDLEILKYKSIEEQEKMAIMTGNESNSLKLATPLTFEVPDEEMLDEITRCYDAHQISKNDLDLFALAFRDFGKGRIKKCGVSPDAFIQMAIQLANYRDQGKFVLTYEPASVRFFANSRTETLRTVNEHSCAFVEAMLNENETKEAKIALLKKACETHVLRNKKCMIGQGIDRHIFVLYILSQGTGIQSPFLDNYISQKWKLSTSHVPNVTNQCDEDTDPDDTWLGACFGAVAADGYGICYRFGGNHGIFANITSYHSAPNTDSTRFAKILSESFHELSNLFV
uniref:Carn_acyltransf domain-containing protein n=1 Tax=Caenorhabditis tropicalis TaxID=1561998 RepID=A0A1I7UMR2_9PELO